VIRLAVHAVVDSSTVHGPRARSLDLEYSMSLNVFKSGRLVRPLVCLALAAIPTVVAPSVANAATPCSEQLCLFDDKGRFIGAYQDVTTSFQRLATGRTATAVNGFADNAVYFKHRNGATSCIQPKREASVLIPDYGRVTGIMIRPNGNCYPNGQIR
jgi:hypothetical protein